MAVDRLLGDDTKECSYVSNGDGLQVEFLQKNEQRENPSNFLEVNGLEFLHIFAFVNLRYIKNGVGVGSRFKVQVTSISTGYILPHWT